MHTMPAETDRHHVGQTKHILKSASAHSRAREMSASSSEEAHTFTSPSHINKRENKWHRERIEQKALHTFTSASHRNLSSTGWAVNEKAASRRTIHSLAGNVGEHRTQAHTAQTWRPVMGVGRLLRSSGGT
jgi:RNA 3'-terminal phosphate cyclase